MSQEYGTIGYDEWLDDNLAELGEMYDLPKTANGVEAYCMAKTAYYNDDEFKSFCHEQWQNSCDAYEASHEFTYE